MDAVALVERRDPGDAREQIGVEVRAGGVRDLRKHAIVVPRIARADHGGRLQARDHHADVAALELLDDVDEVGARLGRIEPAQQIVAAQRHDTQTGVRLDREVHPREAVGGGVARDPGAANPDGMTQPNQRGLQLSRERNGGRQAVTGGDRVAQNGDDGRVRRESGCGEGPRAESERLAPSGCGGVHGALCSPACAPLNLWIVHVR
jgi:hypothetical protein